MSEFTWKNLSITREDGALWIEGYDEPLSRDNAIIDGCRLQNLDTGRGYYVIAIGTREELATMDAPIKIVTAAKSVAYAGSL